MSFTDPTLAHTTACAKAGRHVLPCLFPNPTAVGVADPPNEKGCVHSRITVECAQFDCNAVAVVTLHQPKSSHEPCGVELPDGWRMVPQNGEYYRAACPSHAEAALAETLLRSQLAEAIIILDGMGERT